MLVLTHTVRLQGYNASSDEGAVLPLGTAGSYGIERLRLVPDDAWQGAVLSATFVAGDVRICVLADREGLVEVPHEALARPSPPGVHWRVVFAGVTDGAQRISCDLPYLTLAHAPIDGSAAAPPTPDEFAQFVGTVRGDADRAVQAADRAEDAADDAQAATVHTPVIRGGTWWVWSADTGDYIDTGQSAQADIELADNFDIDNIFKI